jgi:prepilin-type N-terminal cleavage/methylation domain-containing protein
MKKQLVQTAFTLIELLVVISIIAILASVAAPVYSGIIINGKMTSAMNKARQIGLALRLYSGDNEGTFPTIKNSYGEPINNSNDAFRDLIPSYLETESVFAVPGSKSGPTADNQISPASRILERGENHWSYVNGLTATSNSSWPLIVDHTDGSGYYSDKENTFGGTWKGAKSIVITVDSSARIVKLMGTGQKRFMPRFNDKSKNALQLDYMADGTRLLEPAR